LPHVRRAALQIDIFGTAGNEYKFLFMAKGGGSANKTFLFQQTKALLNPDSLMKFLDEKVLAGLSQHWAKTQSKH
jgi:tartrate dehydratase alpha subunit/fumarate hydratase class I-like protein